MLLRGVRLKRSFCYSDYGFCHGRRFSTGDLKSFSVKRVMKVPAALLHDIVSDVESYSSFLPYCTQSIITSRDSNGIPKTARLNIGWNQLYESYESNLIFSDESVIAESNNNTTFKTLYSKWTIIPIKSKNPRCMAELELKFAFNYDLYNTVLANFGPKLSQIMIEAFESRAEDLFEKSEEKSSSGIS